MLTLTDIASLQAHIKSFSSLHPDKTVGFVPTMGALHEGHTSLIKKAASENGLVVCSIFVNPTQFNDPKDLANYPRTLSKDSEMAEAAGCHILFVPTVEEIYPTLPPTLLDISFGPVENTMEGAFRPGHFKGMCTVVKRLFDIVSPKYAYFGEKDYQQLAIVNLMVKQLQIPIHIIPCQTVRENDGLAMSSRNVRLNEVERKLAVHISKTLFWAKDNIENNSVKSIQEQASQMLKNRPDIDLEYFEIVDAESLLPANEHATRGSLRACLAVKIGQTRLIDNVAL